MNASPHSNILLADALHYHSMGIACIPVVDKVAAAKWRQFQDHPPQERTLRNWFKRKDVNGIGLITGIDGLGTMDWDVAGGHAQFAEKHPALAKALPSYKTNRGVQAMFKSPIRRTIRIPGVGEFRAGPTVSVAPHSTHPKGGRYEWITELKDKSQLITIDPEILVPRRMLQRPQNAVSSPSGAAGDSCSAISAVSVTFHVDEVIDSTLPTQPGERYERLFALARGLKFNCGLAGVAIVELREFVRQWHQKALPYISTKAFDETWRDFLYQFERARFPLAHNPVDQAAALIDPGDLPSICDPYESMPARMLAALCHKLGQINDGWFFLSSWDAAERVGLTPMQAWRTLKMFEADGLIRTVRTGNRNTRTATRFIYTGASDE